MAENRLPEPFPTLTVTVGAILASLVMFIGVAYVVLQDPNNERVADNPVGLYVGAMGAIPWLLGIILRRRFLSGQGERLRKEGGEYSDWVSAYVTSHILGAAICESTTVFGFTATFFTGNMSWVLLYAGLSAFGILLGFPTPGRYRQWLRDWGGPDGNGFI